jgi:alkanesulfonate monooxygenase SsuD/methylene tetrahydromethanopterin reductase-like flavin-dependent oxidoreductase (luciferase family)
MATTVDIISKGRLIFGIGAGWHEGEFRGFMGRFPPAKERLRGLEETVEICKRMFTEETSSYKGKLYQVENVLNSPPPIQEHIPIMIGGGGEKRTLKIVAKHGDISHFFPYGGVRYVESKLAALRSHCKAVGRDFDGIRKGVGFGIMLGSSDDELKGKMKKWAERMDMSMENAEAIARRRAHGMISGSVDDVARELSDYRDLGLGLYTFSMLPSPTDEDIRLLYDEVMPVLC